MSDAEQQSGDAGNTTGSVLRIVVETVPNPDVRIFNLNREVSNRKLREYSRSIQPHVEHRVDPEEYEPLSDTAKAILERAIGIPGVVELGIDSYALWVELNVTFDWDTVQPQIIDVLCQVLGTDVIDLFQRDMFVSTVSELYRPRTVETEPTGTSERVAD